MPARPMPVRRPRQASAAVASVAGSALVPSAVELALGPGGSPRSPRPLRVGVLLEGTAPGVAERARADVGAADRRGGGRSGLRSTPVHGASPAGVPRGGLASPGLTVVRVSFWVSALGSVLGALLAAGESAGVGPP